MSDLDATRAQLVIADFNDRRGEINNRTSAQHVLVSLNITAAGAIAGVFFTMDDPDRSLLLLLVPVCTALAMLWADHARKIHIGWYIRYFLRPLVEPDDDGPLWRWEVMHRSMRDRSWAVRTIWKWVGFGVPVMLTFIGPPLFAITFTFEEMVTDGDTRARAAYFAAVAVLVYGAILLGTAVGRGEKPPPSRTSSGPR